MIENVGRKYVIFANREFLRNGFRRTAYLMPSGDAYASTFYIGSSMEAVTESVFLYM